MPLNMFFGVDILEKYQIFTILVFVKLPGLKNPSFFASLDFQNAFKTRFFAEKYPENNCFSAPFMLK